MDISQQKKQLHQMMEQYVLTCRKAGLKVTHQRTEIYRNLLMLPDHPTAENLHKRLLSDLPSISLDTVYRTLATFEQCGLVTRIQTTESQARFEAVYAPHHHLICSRCKKVMDFKWPDIDTYQVPDEVKKWGRINTITVVIYGICNNCESLEPLIN